MGAYRTRLPLVLDPLENVFRKAGGLGARESVRLAERMTPVYARHGCPYFDPRTASGRCLDGTCTMLWVWATHRSAARIPPPSMMVGCDGRPVVPACEGLPPSAIFGTVAVGQRRQELRPGSPPAYDFGLG
jgi:hypothetical protein